MEYPDQRLLQEAQHYVKNLFATRTNKSLTYHNYDHTWDVVQACEQMASHYNISEGDHLVLITAAWFHDTGYLTVGPKDHEDESQRICKAFLKERNASPETGCGFRLLAALSIQPEAGRRRKEPIST